MKKLERDPLFFDPSCDLKPGLSAALLRLVWKALGVFALLLIGLFALFA